MKNNTIPKALYIYYKVQVQVQIACESLRVSKHNYEIEKTEMAVIHWLHLYLMVM